MMKRKNSIDEQLELGQEMSCMSVISYLKSPWPDVSYENYHDTASFAEQKVLPRPRRTHICIWCSAMLCSLVVIAIILSGLAVLTGYLLFHPRLPKVDISKAGLNHIALDTTTFLYNSEMAVLISVTNPNDRIDVSYEYINFKLLFRSDVVATQVLEPFAQTRGNSTLKNIEMVSNDAEITPLSAQIMLSQARNNTIQYQLDGNLRTVARFGSTARIPYWLTVRCQLQFSTPPTGILRDHKCTTKR